MKKTFTSSILFITACLLFSSCAEQFSGSIAKRHYMNGFYVNLNKNKPVESKIVDMKSSIPEDHSLVPTNKKEDVKNVLVENEERMNTSEIVEVSDVAHVNRKSGNALSSSTTSGKIKRVKMLMQNSKEIKNIVSKDKVQMMKQRGGGGGLIWTIIIVLLILWLLGFLLGDFGGLLYILLVIALVLLLLRILGII